MGLFSSRPPVLYVEDLAWRFNQMCSLWSPRIVDDLGVGRSVLIDTQPNLMMLFYSVKGRWYRETMKTDPEGRVISSTPQAGWYAPPITKTPQMAEAIRTSMLEVYRDLIFSIAAKPDRLVYRDQEAWTREAYRQLQLAAPK